MASLLYQLILLVTISDCFSATQIFPPSTNVSKNCQAVIEKLSTLQSTHPQLMAQYWDSWGKPSDGIVYGHTTFLGYYDECMDLKNTPVGETNYCIYTMQMNITTFYIPSEYQDEVCYSSDCPVPINTSVSSNIQVGVCYPSTCSPNEFALVLSRMNIISVTSMTVNPFSNTTQTITIQLTSTGDSPTFCPQTDVEYDMGAMVVTGICVVFVGLVALATVVHLFWQSNPRVEINKDKSTCHMGKGKCDDKPCIKDFLIAFSLCRTVPELFSTKQSSSAIKAVGALKVFANFVNIGLHVYVHVVYPFMYPQLSQNTPHYLAKYPSRIFNQIFMNATFAADTFFVVSATLSSYLTFKDIEKHNRFRVSYFYVNRYFRLAPMFYLVTFVAFKLFVHLSDGPLWHSQHIDCRWWCNVLFINNLINPVDICVVPTWHIGAEMQLFVLSPVFILTLYYSELIGLIVVTLSMFGVTVIIGVVATRNSYWAALYADPKVLEQVQWLYNQSFYRANQYLIGIVLGYILYKKYSIVDLPVRQALKYLISVVLWLIAICLCKITLFGTIEDYNGTRHFTEWENATYLMFSGLAWSVGISVVIFLCNTGYGGVVNSFLSWPEWDPLVRLSYGVYLFHVLVIFYIMGTLQSSLIFTDTVYIMLCVFVIVVSFALSIVLTLTVELPISKVVSLCFKLAGMEPRHA
ncbi:nose resistant to fluoxetine protein 6-like [Dysidea avara]|uniref:nose resistant to fluoxetine protein 6-like n=1 Tax=Dysidea avara TaxID=196820 RepID=UPI00331DE167